MFDEPDGDDDDAGNDTLEVYEVEESIDDLDDDWDSLVSIDGMYDSDSDSDDIVVDEVDVITDDEPTEDGSADNDNDNESEDVQQSDSMDQVQANQEVAAVVKSEELYGEGKLNETTIQTQSHISDESVTCTICMDPWTSSSEHRLVSLKCGHLFGKSCVIKWLKSLKISKQRCPTCNVDAKLSDVRNIYANSLKTIDNSEKERAMVLLEKEKAKVKELEFQYVCTDMKLNTALKENERLKKELMDSQQVLQYYRTNRIKDSLAQNTAELLKRNHEPFQLMRIMELHAEGGCRCLATSEILGYVVVSQPSSNNFYSGYGLKKISSMDFKSNDFSVIHKKPIKDIAFHPHDAVILSASMDRTIKLTSLISNTVTLTYNMDHDPWSVAWNRCGDNIFYVGQNNGVIKEFDTRITTGPIQEMKFSDSSPVVSIEYVNYQPQSGSLLKGTLAANFSRCNFFDLSDTEKYISHSLPFEGRFTSASFHQPSGHSLLSCRPSNKHTNAIHSMIEMSLPHNSTKTERILAANVSQTFEGGSKQVHMTKSRIFSHPDSESSVIVCAGDEQSNGALIWDSGIGKIVQTLRCPSPIYDFSAMKSSNGDVLVALNQNSLYIYKWIQ